MAVVGIAEYFALFMALAGAFGLFVFLRKKDKKKSMSVPLAFIVLLAVGLWFSLPLLSLVFQALTGLGAGGLQGDFKLIDNQTQVFTQKVSPLICEEGNLVFWREFKTYSVTKGNETKKYTTITLFIENKGNASVSNFLLKEKLPLKVATMPSELFNFSITPYGFEQGSVVMTWLFDNIEPGEKKSVSYTVEKEVDAQTIAEYEPPKVVSQSIGPPSEVSKQPSIKPQPAAFDFTLPAIILVMVFLAGLIFYLMRKAQANP